MTDVRPEELTAALRRLVDLVDGLALHTVEERVAAYLWSAFARPGATLVRGAQIRLEEPKRLIAALCGTAPEVLSRSFRRLASEDVVRVNGPVATILPLPPSRRSPGPAARIPTGRRDPAADPGEFRRGVYACGGSESEVTVW